MNIRVMSQDEAINFLPAHDRKTAIIRIHDPEEPVRLLKYESSFADELYVFFHDVRNPLVDSSGHVKKMSLHDAYRILLFVKNYRRSIDTLVIHCHAGVSRSATVALAVCWYLELNDEELLNSGQYCFNTLMLRAFSQYLGLESQKHELINEIDKRQTAEKITF